MLFVPLQRGFCGWENLAPNAGFEKPQRAGVLPDGWQSFSSKNAHIGIVAEPSRNGRQSVKLKTQQRGKSYQGLHTSLPVSPGEKYSFSLFALNDRNDPLKGCARAQLVIEWKGPTENEISRISSPNWNRNLSRMRWTHFSLEDQEVPEGAVKAVFGVHLIEDEPDGAGAFLIDDVEITR
jgi:hypothetical protein